MIDFAVFVLVLCLPNSESYLSNLEDAPGVAIAILGERDALLLLQVQ